MHGDQHVLKDRRQVSIRWLTGTVLTGVTSVALMGGALTAALDGHYSLAAALAPTGLNGLEEDTELVAKGDRITKSATAFSNKQIIDVNVVAREGERDHIRVRPYALVSSTLATRTDPELAAAIPAFNPLNMFSDVQITPLATPNTPLLSESIYGAKVEGEVSISLTSFPLDALPARGGSALSEPEIEYEVRQSARFLMGTAVDAAARAVVDPGRFDFNLARQPDLARYAVRITPENVSFVSKRDDEARFVGMDEKIIPITEEADFQDVLQDHDATPEEAELIYNAFATAFGFENLIAGQRLRIGYAPSPDETGRMRPERISLYSDTDHQATVARSDTGAFVKAKAPATFLADAFAEADRISYGGPTPAIYDSLYQTGLEQALSQPVIDELIRIYSFDVDFNSRVQPGDALELFFAADETVNSETPEILFTRLTTGSSERLFYRFRTPDDGIVDYYDENGQSAKKFLMRKPLSSGRFRSGFGMRVHPIHKYRKMHTGVDWSAPRGTPIMAAGNGTIVKAGWSSGYGRRIELRHANGYTTTYSHLTGFAEGIREGGQVSQGQIIGYVGSTGLSTGPHLHYEVKVNGRFVDPMRIRLPRGRVLDGDMLAAFQQERQRIDTLIDRARVPSRVASAQ
ncbi:peptidase M24 [Roseibium aquae]|uniref:Peptidase M24 n=2 Tax=Roseibium aquae TaxID=1323746 RepID=A0A916TNN0_9HYPH|nr:peptidase M24 [Roseibium aquae]